jgi:hypothetical protein
VPSAEEFYEKAQEHFGWAETAKTERERAIFLQMAAAWLEVARRWEGSASAPLLRDIVERSAYRHRDTEDFS